MNPVDRTQTVVILAALATVLAAVGGLQYGLAVLTVVKVAGAVYSLAAFLLAGLLDAPFTAVVATTVKWSVAAAAIGAVLVIVAPYGAYRARRR